MHLKNLQAKFESEGKVSICQEHPGFVFVDIENSACVARISLYGGQLLSYKQKEYGELLYLSSRAIYRKGEAIRGGVPVCWPAFGASNKKLPFHGFVRKLEWELKEITQLKDEQTQVSLVLESNEVTRQLWPYEFRLELKITLGNTVKLELITENTGAESFELTQALHSYFRVSDITEARVDGLDGTEYLDTTIQDHEEQQKKQEGSVRFEKEVDNVYMDVSSGLDVVTGKGRQFRLESMGSQTVVVWNPWSEISESKDDLENDAYCHFICVETANAFKDSKYIEPGAIYTMGAEYSF